MNCASFPMQDLASLLQFIFGILSLISCMLIILPFFFISKLNTFYFRVILYLCINDAVRSIIYLWPISSLNTDYLCEVLSVIHTACLLNSIIWSMLIFQAFYKILNPEHFPIEKLEKFWLLTTLFMTPVLCTLPILTNSYKLNYTLCTFGDDTVSNYWRFTLFFLPAWVFSVLAVVYCCLVYRHEGDSEIGLLKSIIMKKILAYPAYMEVVLVLLTVLRVLQLFVESNCLIEWMYLVSEGMLEIQGFFNFVCFVMISEVQSGVRCLFRRPHKKTIAVSSSSGTNLLYSEYSTSVINV